MKIYCPSCGETTEQTIEDISPGTIGYVCNHCYTAWYIDIEYSEKENQVDTISGKPGHIYGF